MNYTNMQHTNLLPDYGWYKISGSHLSWERAREYCESQSTHLWVPSSQQELTEIQEIDNFGEDYYLWVGISMTYEWTTVSGELLVNLLSKNWTLNMSEWDEDCLTLNSEGFQSNLCDYKAAVVCEWNAVNFTCQPGYIRFDDVCYKTNDTYVTWNEAQCFCKAQGGRLAVPTSQEQLEVLLDMADPLSTWPWLGIYKNATGSWSTVKGQQEWSFNMPYWPPENLNDSGNCIAFHQNRLTKKSCSTKYMFICKQNQGTAIATMLPRIEKENHILTMILGTNGKDWGVQPGKRVTLTCKSEHELVKWSYPKVQQEFQPKETRKFWDNEEGITLTYTSVHINNTGIHRCFTTRNSTNKADINLLVSEKYVTKRQYKLLPNVGSYKLVNEDMEWSTAKTHCEAENGHLMVPTSPKEWAALREMASNTDVWLGVRRTGEWTAVTDNNHVSDDFVDWNSGKAEGNGGCVTLSEFVLQDASCTLQHPFFCKYTSTNSTCPLRYIPVSLSDCVQLNKTELTWQRARQWCESLGLSLAVPNSQQMKDLLQNLIKSGAITAWVGIHRLHEKWTAYDGAQSTFSGVKWISTNVDEGGDCIFFREKKLLTTDCTSLKHFICQIKDVEQELHVPLQWWAILSITVLSVAAFILISVSIVLGYRLDRQRALRQTLLLGNGGEQPLESFLVDQMHQLPFNKKWEFPANHLQLGDLLGAGEFDVVRQAKACFIIPGQTVSTVAVKTVNRGADMSCLKALVLEMKILSHLGQHLNIVNFLGACTKGLGKGKLHIIVEYCPYGNLKNYLVNHRNSFVDQLELRRKTVHLTPDSHTVTSSGPKASEINKQCIAELEDFGIESSQTLWMAGTSLDAGVLTTRDLMSWSYQVAKGMDYLTSRKVIHGDLAARNVLLADNNIVKICDFGLARNLTYSCYYKKKEDDLLPVKWMSPEALSDHKFSPQSDVWAFGVLLWEFFSLGASPYPGIPLPNLFEQLQGGHRLKQPILAPIDIYHVMVRCWDADPQQRPVFSILTHELGDCLEEGVIEGYLKFHKSHFKRNQSNTEPNYMKELLDSTMNVPPSTSAHAEPSRGLIPPVPVQESRI